MSHDREARKKNKGDLETELKRKWRRYNQLWKEARNLGKVELDEPIRHGWKRTFVLNEQTKNRRDAQLIQQVLDKVNTEFWSRERDWSKIKPYWKGMPDINGCQLNPLTPKEYNKLTDRQKKYFTKAMLCYGSPLWNPSALKEYYIISKPNMLFRMKDRKYWITEVPVFDPEIDRETEEIWDWIHGHGLYGKLANKMGWRQNYKDPYDMRRQIELEKMNKKEMREYFNECLNKDQEEKEFLERFVDD